jgi:Outer membrane protein beta-barrel domain
MKFSIPALLIVALAIPSAQAAAQRDDQFVFGIGGGATIPSAAAKDNHTTGVHGTLSWGIGMVDSPWGIRCDGTYSSLGDKDSSPGPVDQGAARVFMLSGNGIFNIYGSNNHLYMLAGLGGYWYNPDGPETSTKNDLGLQAGLGVFLPGANVFLEAKWVNLYRAMPDPVSGLKGKKSARLYPVTLGIMF